jgi:hypothetical protein
MAIAYGAGDYTDTQKSRAVVFLLLFPVLAFCYGIYNGRIGSFGILYKVLRAEKRKYEVYTILLLSLYILDTIEAGVLLAIGSAYLNLY